MMIARRLVVFGSLVTLTGCATRSLEECDPHTGGPFDYLACQNQYKQRHQNKVDQLLDDEDRYRDAQAENQRLEVALASLSEELNATNARIAQLRAARDALESRLASAQGATQALQDILLDTQRFLKDLAAANLHVANYELPYLPASGRIDAARRNVPAIQRQASDVWSMILAHKDELTRIGEKLATHLVEGEVLKTVIEKVLTVAALDEFVPIVGWAATGHLIWEGVEAYRDASRAVTRGS